MSNHLILLMSNWYDFFMVAALLLHCSHAATIKRSATSESPNLSLPWNGIFSFISYYATSTPSYDTSSDGDSWQDDCKEEQDSPSRETIIIYDIEEQVLPSKNQTNATRTNSTEIRSAKHKRETEGSTELSEGRHKDVRPYPGFFLGRKLWYVPLWFGIYYSFYLLCLVVRSVSRHRINYPALLPADTTLERKKSHQKKKNLDAMARQFSDSVQMYNNYYRPYQ